MNQFNACQYQDLLARPRDLYAHTKYRILLDWLAAKPKPLRILNAGCGSGELSFLLAEAGHDVLGVDASPAYIELAKRTEAQRAVPRCAFEVCSIEDLRVSRPYDCVIAADVIEHIQDDVKAIEKLVACVRPGGLLMLTVPAGPWLFGFHDESLGHFRRYSIRSLRGKIGRAVGIDRVRYFGFTMIPVCLLYGKLLRRPYPVADSGDSRTRPLTRAILHALLQIDKSLPLPLGTSILLMGTVPAVSPG
ncbi:MAG: methyltransferase domain-containing protein [Verrucomicrobia bacterium]|nr:methyltransferase domain-containing protein [Verrucomicrobiota bacterium]